MYIMITVFAALAVLFITLAVKEGKNSNIKALKRCLKTSGIMTALSSFTVIFNSIAMAAGESGFTDNSAAFFSAALATGLAACGAGYAVAVSASAAIGAISENEKISGKALIFVAMGEGIALYGVLIAVMILSRI